MYTMTDPCYHATLQRETYMYKQFYHVHTRTCISFYGSNELLSLKLLTIHTTSIYTSLQVSGPIITAESRQEIIQTKKMLGSLQESLAKAKLPCKVI